MKTDFASIVQEFERLKVARGYRQQQREQGTELPHASARHTSQVNTSQGQSPSHLDQNLSKRYVC